MKRGFKLFSFLVFLSQIVLIYVILCKHFFYFSKIEWAVFTQLDRSLISDIELILNTDFYRLLSFYSFRFINDSDIIKNLI